MAKVSDKKWMDLDAIAMEFSKYEYVGGFAGSVFKTLQKILQNQNHDTDVSQIRNWLGDTRYNDMAQEILNAIDAARAGDADATRFLNAVRVISGALASDVFASKSQNTETQKVLLGRIDKIKSPDVQYKFLRVLRRNAYDKEVIANIQMMIAHNPNHTISDLYRAMEFVDMDTKKKMRNDGIAMAREQLAAEMQKEIPDERTINDIIDEANYIANNYYDRLCNDLVFREESNVTQEECDQAKEYSEQIKQEFDFDKLMLPDGIEYLAKIENDLHDDIADLKRRIAELEQQLESVTKAKDLAIGKDEANQKRAQQQIDALNQENKKMEQRLQTANAKAEKAQNNVRKLTQATKKMQSSLFSRGVKKARTLGQQIEKEYE